MNPIDPTDDYAAFLESIARGSHGNPGHPSPLGDPDDWRGPPDTFALRVADPSMLGDHIAPGDTAIIERRSWAVDGQAVAAGPDERSARLWVYRDDGDRAWLESRPGDGGAPCVQVAGDGEAPEILGVVVGMYRAVGG